MKQSTLSPSERSRGDSSDRRLLESATSFLFVPGDRPERFPKALQSDANVVIIDWEASVIASGKNVARHNTIAFLANSDARRIAIRVNPVSSSDFHLDAAALHQISGQIAGVFLTMVDSADQVTMAQEALPPNTTLVGMIETARAVVRVDEIASAKPLCRLAFGNMDYQTDVDLPPDEHVGLIYPSSRIVVASRSAGLPAPIAGVTENIADLDVFEQSARFERNLGFLGKLCVHPTQLALTQAIFAPSAAEIEWAERVITATQNTHAVMMDGRMIDRPVIERARKILNRAKVVLD
ncbi:CoA ester lyase [Burkholderia ambifaria]|uniref:HpcH/HpaI aldolase/citrate lyase family protein n=1 Tax=Burkholderia ambifaria TaxID=152480 RepID=UPI00315C8140